EGGCTSTRSFASPGRFPRWSRRRIEYPTHTACMTDCGTSSASPRGCPKTRPSDFDRTLPTLPDPANVRWGCPEIVVMKPGLLEVAVALAIVLAVLGCKKSDSSASSPAPEVAAAPGTGSALDRGAK